MTDQGDDELWEQANALKDKMLQVIVDDHPTDNVAMLAMASLAAQVLSNLAAGDSEAALEALHEIWLPNIEAIIETFEEEEGHKGLHPRS